MKHSLLLNIFLINIIKIELLHLYMNHRYMYAHKVNNYCLCSEAIHFHWSKIHFQSYTVPYWPPPSHTVWTPSAWRSSCELAPCLFFPFLVSADNCPASGNQNRKNKFISTRNTSSKYEGILFSTQTWVWFCLPEWPFPFLLPFHVYAWLPSRSF